MGTAHDVPPSEDPVTTDRERAYAEWAQRLREKRSNFKRSLDGAGGDPTTYWTSDVLFAESKRVEEEELLVRTDDAAKNELLAVLDLRDDADPERVAAAYRQLAKKHHPDRYASADEATREWHAARMAAINEAYAALRKHD